MTGAFGINTSHFKDWQCYNVACHPSLMCQYIYPFQFYLPVNGRSKSQIMQLRKLRALIGPLAFFKTFSKNKNIGLNAGLRKTFERSDNFLRAQCDCFIICIGVNRYRGVHISGTNRQNPFPVLGFCTPKKGF